MGHKYKYKIRKHLQGCFFVIINDRDDNAKITGCDAHTGQI